MNRLQLIPEWRQCLAMWSVRVQLIWAVVCQVFVVLPRDQQAHLVGLLGLHGDGAVTGVAFLAQVSVAIAAATVASRVTHQPALHQPAPSNQPEDLQ